MKMTQAKSPAATKLGDGRYSARIRYAKGQRQRFAIKARSDAEADKRAAVMQELASMLAAADKSEHAPAFLKKLGEADPSDVAELRKLAGKLCEGKAQPERGPSASTITVRQLGERWTGGALHREYPDQIKFKRSADDDAGRLSNYVYPVIGPKPIASVTLDDCEAIMRRLPAKLRPATRRNVARTVSRLFKMAVYPLRIIAQSPIPEGFVPKLSGQRALAYLYPDEDRRLMTERAIPFCYRLLWGFLSREGMRASEAFALTWSDLDLARGAVRLDRNKTDDPRAWALDAGVARALARVRDQRLAELAEAYPDAEERKAALAAMRVFTDEHGRMLSAYGMAELLREHLDAIGLKRERPELFTTTAERQRIRVHDLRGTFVTVSLANGKSEAWVSDRTGHRSSQMIARYKRTARTFAELGLGELAPLDQAVPEVYLSGPAEPARVGRKVGHRNKSQLSSVVEQRFRNSPTSDTAAHGSGKDAPLECESRTSVHDGPPVAQGAAANCDRDTSPPVDVVEAALAAAIERTTDPAALIALAAELRARREARAAVVSLDAERAKRGAR